MSSGDEPFQQLASKCHSVLRAESFFEAQGSDVVKIFRYSSCNGRNEREGFTQRPTGQRAAPAVRLSKTREKRKQGLDFSGRLLRTHRVHGTGSESGSLMDRKRNSRGSSGSASTCPHGSDVQKLEEKPVP